MSGEFLQREIDGRGFQIYVPPQPHAEPPPAILFLHGRGESGNDGRQTEIGLAKSLREHPERWPFVTVFPQKLDPWVLWDGYRRLLVEILKLVDGEFETGTKFLTGLSQGGHGTLTLAKDLPWTFAAIAPVCGWCEKPELTAKLSDIPTWLFHGDQDQAVPVQASIDADEQIRAVGGDSRLTIYPGVGHNSWDLAYDDPALPQWFLSHQR